MITRSSQKVLSSQKTLRSQGKQENHWPGAGTCKPSNVGFVSPHPCPSGHSVTATALPKPSAKRCTAAEIGVVFPARLGFSSAAPAGTCQAQSWPRAGLRQQMGLSGEGLQHRPRSWGRISISGGTGLTGPGSEQGPADGRCPSQAQAFHQSHLHMVLSPALSSPSSFSLLSACTAVISCCWLSCPPPDIVPTRSASQDAPYALTTHFNPVLLVSYRNMFPSNLVEASFQQVSSPEPSACSQDGAQLHTGLLLCPPTAWTGASSLLFLSLPSLSSPSRSLPLSSPNFPFIPPPSPQGGHPKAGGCWRGTGSQDPPCLPSACQAPVQKQHTSPSLIPLLCSGFLVPGEGQQRGGQAAGRGRDTKGRLREGRVVKGDRLSGQAGWRERENK